MTDPSGAIARALARLRRLSPADRTRLIEKVADSTSESAPEIATLLDTEPSDEFLSPGGPLGGALGAHLVRAVEDLNPSEDLVGGSVGEIRIDSVLGDGGFGRVYLGRDEKLERDVAVKVLHSRQRFRQEARDRLRREARLLSKLDHPNICRIYGLLEEGADDYLLLEYIAGARLTEAAAGTDLETRLDLARQVAAALAAAHAEGIIHRDLKPDNVLVTAEGTAKVLDLGIAGFAESIAGSGTEPVSRPQSSAESRERDDLTRLGSKLGTIRYMSPEQARGEAVTTASDLFAFGLLLHELFGEASAYAGDSDEALFDRVQQGVTAPFVHPDPDLAQLVSALLRADPAARPTAAETIERITDLLDRPRLRRRRLIRRAAAAAVILAVVSVLVGWWVLRQQAARDIAAAEELLSQVKDIEWRMRAEHLSPPHDITPAREEVRERLEELSARIGELGSRATGRGRYAIGRAALSIDDLARAREEVEAAWHSGYQTPEVAYTLGRILARMFRDEVEWSDRRYKPEEQEEQLERLRNELGEPAARFLRLAKGAQVEAPEYVESLLAVSEEEYGRALDLLSEVDLPWFYERHLLTGWIQLKLAVDQRVRGSVEGFARHASEAAAAYSRATEVGGSDPAAHVGLCRARSFGIFRTQLPADQSLAMGDLAIEACEKALKLDPLSVEAHWELASTHYGLAQAGFNSGEDARRHLLAGERIAEAGLAMAPGSEDLQRSLVKTLWRKAVDDQLRGVDPGSTYEKGRKLAEALAWAPTASEADMQSYVLIAIDEALYKASQGSSPVPTLERATEIAERSIAIEPSSAALVNLAICHYILASYQAGHGVDPSESVDKGLAVVRRSLAAVPDQLVPLRVLGNMHLVAHQHAVRIGDDLDEPLAAAREAYGRALEVNPDFIWARLEWVVLELQHARGSLDRGESPEKSLATARVHLAEIAKSADLTPYRLAFEGRLELIEGLWQAERGLSPTRSFQRAESLLRRSIAANELEAEPFVSLAETLYQRALRLVERGTGGEAGLIEEGLAAVAKALDIQSDSAEAYEQHAALLRLEAQLQHGPTADATTEEAARVQAKACAINQFLGSCSADASRSGATT